MNSQEKFYKSVEDNDIQSVELLLNNPTVNPSFKNNEAIGLAAEHGFKSIFLLLLDDPRVNPADFDNWAIIYASRNGHFDIVQILLNDSRVDQQVIIIKLFV
jgi:hypothetical protein